MNAARVRYTAVGLALLGGAPTDAANAARDEPQLDPIGIWACVAYANRVLEDERFALYLAPQGGTSWARQYDTRMGRWAALSNWVADRDRLVFTESAGGRRFTADLKRATLGGDWTSPAANGGWWCIRRLDASFAQSQSPQTSAGEFFVAPLMPDISATPTYPREAIREGKEGRAIACFFVDADGAIVEPEILEVSDEVFRYATIAALYGSRYYPSGSVARAGCRSYLYELDQVH